MATNTDTANTTGCSFTGLQKNQPTYIQTSILVFNSNLPRLSKKHPSQLLEIAAVVFYCLQAKCRFWYSTNKLKL